MPVGLSPNTARISNYKRVAISLLQLIKNILTTKQRTAWWLISVLARSLFRLLDQSQTL